MKSPRIDGLHHVTMLSADAARTAGFYTGVLGLHLVGRTIVDADPSALHFYVGDAAGTPGSLLSFVVRRRERRCAAGQAGPIVLAAARGSLPAWRGRLAAYGVDVLGLAWAFGEQALCFTDPDGLELALIEDDALISAEIAGRIRAIEIQVAAFEPARRLLVDLLGFETVGHEGPMLRLRVGATDRAASVDLLLSQGGGPGPIRRIAWQVENIAALDAAAATLNAAGVAVSLRTAGPFFSEIEFAGPDGMGYALATNSRGFSPGVVLPPELEPQRAAIERRFARLALRR